MTRTSLFAPVVIAALMTAVPVSAQQTHGEHGEHGAAAAGGEHGAAEGHMQGRAAYDHQAANHPPSTPEELEVVAVIERLFEGMRAGDSTMVRSVFHPEVRMTTSFRREGAPVHAIEESVDGFVQAVGTPHDEVWDERIWSLMVRVDDDLAIAWMNFAFFAGDRFSHCGVNFMQLVRTADGWKIVNLGDTRRREDCDLPEDLQG